MATPGGGDLSEAVYGLGITPGLGYITGPEGQRAEAEALRKDRSRARRVVVSLVGRERQGKTSLRRLLAGEPFDKDEPSTVGLERDLVETQALDPGSSPGADWRAVTLLTANRREYHEVLGRKIHQRLENRRHRIPATRRVINACLTMSKIGVITYFSMFLFFSLASSSAGAAPVWGITMVGMFALCGATFGRRDGFGIAVGIYQLMLLCESTLRWRLGQAAEGDWGYGVALTCLCCVAWYGLVESAVAVCFGLSLGLGMACVFCLSAPPRDVDYYEDGSPLTRPELHLMVLGCLVGLGLVQNRHSRLLIPVVVGVMVTALPPASACVFLCGAACGTFHGPSLGVGRSLFLTLNLLIKEVTTYPLGRHMPEGVVRGPASSPAPNGVPLPDPGAADRRDGQLRLPPPPSPRLLVRDFAGHPLYYSTHHVYMSAQCVYVLVFSLAEARLHFAPVLRSLIDWLQSIYLHAAFPDTRVFVVGTHRDHPSLRDWEGEEARGEGGFVGSVGRRLRTEIPRSFHNLLVWTQDDMPLFPVENSLRDHKDKDHRYLRQQLLKTASEINTDKFPVRYFYFFHVLDDLRSQGRLLADTDDLRLQCGSNQCAIRDEADMDALLGLFRRLGEVLYFPDDNLLQSVVVLSPQGVLSVLSRLMDVPKRADRARHVLMEWDRLSATGVCSRALFEHVLHVHAPELGRQSDTVLYLLQTLNLMCPLKGRWGPDGNGGGGGASFRDLRHRGSVGGRGGGGGGGGDDSDDDNNGGGDDGSHDGNEGESSNDDDEEEEGKRRRRMDTETLQHAGELYLVPSALRPDLAPDLALWDTSAQDWTLLVDGVPLLPHPAFLRLLSACAAQDACHSLDDLGWPVLSACQARAAFTLGAARCYKLEWLGGSEVSHTYHGRLLKLVVAGWEGSGGGGTYHPHQNYPPERGEEDRGGGGGGGRGGAGVVSPQSVAEFVWRTLAEIVRRDFGRCRLRLGVACPCPAPHQISCQGGFHFLSLSDTRDGIAALHVPDCKEFWCRGRHVVYRRGQVRESGPPDPPWAPGEARTGGGRGILDTPLNALPLGLHARICDLLDVPHVLGNDWTALAGHLGKTVQEVALLKFRAPRDPCDALLQDWACRQPDVTLRHLLHVMQRMTRLDVIKTIQDFALEER
ncbi:hypothetical protein ACOMHN_067278 [Nucella lapillus]